MSAIVHTQSVEPTQEAAAPAAGAAPGRVVDAAALGLGGFALSAFLLSVINAGLVDASAEPIVFGVALMYGGVAQLLAGMWEFRSGNAFGGAVFASYAAFWLSFWAFGQFYAKAIPEGEAGAALGLYLVGWGIYSMLLWVASLRTNVVLCGLLSVIIPTFFVLAIGNAGGHPNLIKLGGWLGLVVTAGAWYLVLAHVTEATFKRAVLPTGPLGRAHL